MKPRNRTQIAFGVILILLGVWLVLDQRFPALHAIFLQYTRFPLNMLVIGAGIFLLGLILAQPGMSVPAVIVAGIGGIFYYQQVMNDYASWSYMWALIPGFVGIGSVLAGLLGENRVNNLKRGLNLIAGSALLFLIFSSFLGGWKILGNYTPAFLLIGIGLYIFASGLFRTLRKKDKS